MRIFVKRQVYLIKTHNENTEIGKALEFSKGGCDTRERNQYYKENKYESFLNPQRRHSINLIYILSTFMDLITVS